MSILEAPTPDSCSLGFSRLPEVAPQTGSGAGTGSQVQGVVLYLLL